MEIAQCKYCGADFEKKRPEHEFCRTNHRHNYRHRSKKYAGQPNRCPHTFKLSYDTAEEASAAPYANSAIHDCYLCRCGKWHYGRNERFKDQ